MERVSRKEFRRLMEERTLAFSVSTFRLLDALPARPSCSVIARQLGKSASSIGANYREACRAESADDFAHKISIATKEAAETEYWFGVLAGLCPDNDDNKPLAAEAVELRNLMQAISASSRGIGRTGSASFKQSNHQKIKQL